MKKLLYVAALPINFDKFNGVAKKVLSHIKVFKEEFDSYLLCYHENKVLLVHGDDKQEIMKGKNGYDVLRAIKKINIYFDNIYIRYPKSSPFFLAFLKKVKGSKIVVEIPTYPYDSEGYETFVSRIQKIMDGHYRKKINKYVDRIVTYSDDDEIFGIKTIKTINGIDFENTKISKPIAKDGVYHFIAVSNMYEINGFERLIIGLDDYYKKKSDTKIYFDIVGDGPSKRDYEKIVTDHNLNEYVIFHGLKFGDDLNLIYDKAVLGVNSLAIHRHNLKKESTLKTKEYGAKGLLIVSSSEVDSFTNDGKDNFVFMVKPDDSALDIAMIVDFVKKSLSNFNGSECLKKMIRCDSKEACDMKKTLVPVINFFNEKRV